MFTELMPLIQNRPLTITIAAIDDKQIRVNVIPAAIDKDEAANKPLGYSHKKEVAEIPDKAIKALTTPLSLTGTPVEIDAQLPQTLTQFTSAHLGLQNSYNSAAAAIKSAVKAIDERERTKKEQDKAKGKKSTSVVAKAEEKKEAESLPSLFTLPPAAPPVVSANDSPSAKAAPAVATPPSEPIEESENEEDENEGTDFYGNEPQEEEE